MITSDYWGSSVVWFTGVVEDRLDPLEANRVRARIHGIHPDFQSELSTGDLPWAIVGMPCTTGGSSGVGSTPHRLVEGAWVYGIFLDGAVAQQPLILGTILGVNEVDASDPCGISNSTGTMDPGDPGISHGSVPPINVPGNNHREKAFNYFLTKGYTPEQSAGIVGNLMMESGTQINPTVVNGIGATGSAQWLGDRKTRLFSWSKQNGYDWRALETQLLFISYELNSSESRANRLVKQTSTPEDAALAFCTFERDETYSNGRCNPNAGTTRKRMGYARDTYNKYAGGRSTTPQNQIAEDRATRATLEDQVDDQGNVTSATPSTGGYSTSSRCSPTDVIESEQKLSGVIAAAIPQTIQIVSSNDTRDIKVDASQIDQPATLLIERDGTIRQLGEVGTTVVVVLEGGNASFTYATGQSENFIGHYPPAQLRSLIKVIKAGKATNANVKIDGEQAAGLDRSIFEGLQ